MLVVFKDWISVAGFYMNQEYIAANLCLNIEQPEVLCSGKCYLNTVITENHSETENSQMASQEKQNNINLLYTDYSISTKLFLDIPFQEQHFFISSFHSNAYLDNVFRPPVA